MISKAFRRLSALMSSGSCLSAGIVAPPTSTGMTRTFDRRSPAAISIRT
jgi:hypothetical protein